MKTEINLLVLVYAKYAELYHFYQNPITLSQISKVGKISITQCYRDFKSIIKMSPYKKY